MKKRVCLTTLEFPPDVGGVGESAYRIAGMLQQFGYEVHVAVFRAVFPAEQKLAQAGDFRRSQCHTTEKDGIIVHRLKPAVRSVDARVQDYLSDLYGQLEQLHQRYQFDIFHAFFINETGFLTTLLAKDTGTPVINSIRGADLHKHCFDPKQFGPLTWTLAHSSWVTAVSRDLLKRACLLVPEIRSRSSAFLNSIYPVSFDHLPTPSLVSKLQGTVIGSVGRFRDKKGLEHLLDACHSLLKDTDITLLLVGDIVPKEKGYWEQEIHNADLGDRLIITGLVSREEALAYLPHIDIFAIPSLHDGCPNALLEAMLAGRAIVGTRVDAIGEILDHEKNGLVINPSDSDALEHALRQLIAQPELRQRLGQLAKETVLKDLSPAVEQHNWNSVYQQIEKQSSPDSSVNGYTLSGYTANENSVNENMLLESPDLESLVSASTPFPVLT